MAHPYIDDIRKSHGDKLDSLVGARGEHSSERAVRIVGKNSRALAAENTTGKAQRDDTDEFKRGGRVKKADGGSTPKVPLAGGKARFDALSRVGAGYQPPPPAPPKQMMEDK